MFANYLTVGNVCQFPLELSWKYRPWGIECFAKTCRRASPLRFLLVVCNQPLLIPLHFISVSAFPSVHIYNSLINCADCWALDALCKHFYYYYYFIKNHWYYVQYLNTKTILCFYKDLIFLQYCEKNVCYVCYLIYICCFVFFCHIVLDHIVCIRFNLLSYAL